MQAWPIAAARVVALHKEPRCLTTPTLIRAAPAQVESATAAVEDGWPWETLSATLGLGQPRVGSWSRCRHGVVRGMGPRVDQPCIAAGALSMHRRRWFSSFRSVLYACRPQDARARAREVQSAKFLWADTL